MVEHRWRFCCYFDCDEDGNGIPHEECEACGAESWGDREEVGPCTAEAKAKALG